MREGRYIWEKAKILLHFYQHTTVDQQKTTRTDREIERRIVRDRDKERVKESE